MNMPRGRLILVAWLAALLAAGAVAYKQWPRLLQTIRRHTASSQQADNQVFASPPFSTKEPDRYQATRVITNGEAGVKQTYAIARDGENRREDSNGGITYLETHAGSFLLYPATKLYADLNADSDELAEGQRDGDFSPDRLLHETSTGARYQLLGSDSVGDRKTTKYKVTSGDWQAESTVSLIWVDEELGIPIKSEIASIKPEGPVKVTIELRDIRQNVDARLFELPPDFTKVTVKALLAEVARAGGQTKENASRPTKR